MVPAGSQARYEGCVQAAASQLSRELLDFLVMVEALRSGCSQVQRHPGHFVF